MKKLLLLWLFLCAFFFHDKIHAQTYITLNADTNSVYVGAYEHPVNTLRAKYSDSGLAIIGTDNTVFTADRKYNTYINGATSEPFETLDSLKAWVRQYFFVDASAGASGGGDTLTLGETSTTAYRGDRGKTAYDHSQLTSGTNPHNTTFANIASKPTTVSGFGITDALVIGGQSIGSAMSVGTNDNNIFNIRANNATRAVFTPSGTFLITGGITTNTATISPTHSLTIPSVGTGIAFYNTVDQTTNYERLTITKAANVFNISTSAAGTGIVRDLSVNGTVFNGSGVTATKFNVSALNTAPASATDTGTTGEVRITAGFIYVCTATNTWVRAALATW